MASLGTLLSREVTMQTKIDRRSILAAAVLCCSSILVPREAFSLPQGGLPESEPVTIYANPGKTLGQIEAELHAHAENEARRIIAEAMSQNNGGITPFGRPTYSTVYGTTQYKRTGVHDVAGQPAGGIKINGGGSVYVTPSGGGTVTVSVSLPGGLSLDIGIEKGSKSVSVTSWAINIPGDSFYKVTANITYAIKPYVVYVTQDGVRKVYRKNASKQLYSVELNKRRV